MEDPIRQQREEQQVYDMTSEFTCFLCNGYTSVVGSVTVNEAGIKLCSAMGQALEIDTFDEILSVNEMEPANAHTVILTFCTQRYVMVSHLLRKDKFIEIFTDLGIYKSEPCIPPESIGMKDPEIFAKAKASVDANTVFSTYGRNSHMTAGHCHVTGGHSHMIEENNHMTERHKVEESEMKGEESESDSWNNQSEQDRHVQRQIRQQSLLNPIQMISSIQQTRASELTADSNDDYKQLHKYPSSVNKHGGGGREGDSADPSNKTNHKRSTSPTTTNTSSSQTKSSVSDFTVNLANLKLLFPNHREDELQTVLTNCGGNLDSSISTILGEDESANAFNS